MIALQLRVIAQGIEVLTSSDLVSGSVEIYTAEFEFNDAWNGFTKTALFDYVDGNDPTEVVMPGTSCTIPWEPLEKHGYLRVGVCGVNGTQVMPTVWTELLQIKEGAVAGSIHIEPSETTYEQVMDLLAGIDGGTGGQILAKQSDVDYDFKWVDNPAQYVPGTEGDVVVIGSNNNIVDSGVSMSDILPTKSASGRVIKIYDGAEGMPLKSAILHINPRKLNSNVIRHWRTILNVRKHLLLTGTDFLNQILRYSSSASSDTENKFVSLPPSSTADTARGGYDGLQYLDEPYTFALTLQKASGTNTASCLRFFYNYNQSYSNFHSLASPVTTKQAVIHNVDVNALNGFFHTNRGSQATRLYYEESYIVDGEITSMDQVPEYVGEQIVREFPADVEVYAGEFNLLTGELSVCPVIESYNGETLTGEWFSSLDDYAPGTTPTTGAFVVDLAGEKTTYQLEPVILHTLNGYNRIWADFRFYTYSNELEIEYCCDPTIAIEEKAKEIKKTIAPVEEGYTASQAYAVGSFLYVGDTLYKVTSAIASGATITPNTNVVATTVAEQLMALA